MALAIDLYKVGVDCGKQAVYHAVGQRPADMPIVCHGVKVKVESKKAVFPSVGFVDFLCRCMTWLRLLLRLCKVLLCLCGPYFSQ